MPKPALGCCVLPLLSRNCLSFSNQWQPQVEVLHYFVFLRATGASRPPSSLSVQTRCIYNMILLQSEPTAIAKQRKSWSYKLCMCDIIEKYSQALRFWWHGRSGARFPLFFHATIAMDWEFLIQISGFHIFCLKAVSDGSSGSNDIYRNTISMKIYHAIVAKDHGNMMTRGVLW